MLMKRLNVAMLAGMALLSVAYGLEKPKFVSVELSLETSGSVSGLKDFGRVVSRSGSRVVLRLDSIEGLSDQIAAVKGLKGVTSVEALAPLMPTLDIHSEPLSRLKLITSEYKSAYKAWALATNASVKTYANGDIKAPGTSFLEGYLQWKHDRAYPNDSIDLSAYAKAANERYFADLTGVIGPKRAPGEGSAAEGDLGQWEFIGPRDLRVPYTIYFGQSPINGRANCVAFDHLNANTFYAGGAQGGVWKTTDAGVTWSTTSDGWPTIGVSAIAVKPTDSNIVLAGTGDFFGSDVAGIGVMRSTDAGATWTRTGLNMGTSGISKLIFLPESPNTVIATAGKFAGAQRGIYRSVDSGANWSEVFTSDRDWADADISIPDGTGARILWASAGGSTTGGVVKSTNGGTSWTAVTLPAVITGNQNPLQIAASKTDPDGVYVLSTTNRKIVKSSDGGATWTDVSAGFQNGSNNYNWSQGWYDYYMETSVRAGANGPEDMVFVGLIDVVMSTNGGTTWRNIGGSNYTAAYSGTAIVHQDNHNIAIDPNNPLRALVATDGGVFLFNYNNTNDTVSWSKLNKTLGITQFYTLAVHPTNPDYVKGGTQDNSTPHSFGNLFLWGNPGAGDGAGCAINHVNPNIQYNSSQFHGLERTTNAYSSSSGFAPNFGSDSVPFIGDLWLDPNDPTNVYVNTNFLWRYKEGTGVWSARLGGTALSTSGQVRSMGFSSNSNIFYTGASDGDLYMTRDFGATWKRLDTLVNFTNRSILGIKVNPNNTDDIVVAVGGSGSHLYRITNTNAATPTLTDVSGAGATGLPNVAANCVELDPFQPSTKWYVGTDIGVYMTENAGATWTDITRSKGLPNTQVNRLVANPTTGYITAATFGRGMWRISLAPAELSSMDILPAVLLSGDSSIVRLVVDRPAPVGGFQIGLTSSHADVQVPATVTVPQGATSVDVPLTTTESGNDVTSLIRATFGRTLEKSVVVRATTDFTLERFTLQNWQSRVGSLAAIRASEDIRLSWQNLNGTAGTTTLYGVVRVAPTNPNRLRLEIEASGTVAGLQYRVTALNTLSGLFEPIATGALTTTDQIIKVDLPTPQNYTNSPRGLQIGFEVTKPAPVSAFRVQIDRFRVRLLP
jgi:photosystem II stability/assembly factor-like uncharacterized protein